MNDAAVKEVLTKMSEYGIDATTAPIHVPDILRQIGWAIVKFLGTVADALYIGIVKICEVLSFAKSDGLQELVNSYSFILQAMLIVTLVGSGLYFMAKKADTQTSVALNLTIMIVVFTCMPLITSEFADLTSAGVSGFLEKGAKTYQSEVAANYYATGGNSSGSAADAGSITSVVIANNMVDLIEVDKNVSASGKVTGLSKDKGYINRSSILDGNWKKIKITSVMDYDHGNLKNDDIWDQSLTQPELGTDSGLDDMDGFFSSLNDYYYRWQVVSWFNIFMNLLIMVCVLFFVSLKCATLIFGIAAAQIYMPFIAATDLVIGQRIKAALRNFISLFGAILLCIALMGLYFVGFSWIESQNFGLGSSTNTYLRIVLQIALAWMVINGPDIIEQIIGVDIGLRSGWQAIMGLRAAGQIAAGTGHVAARAGRTASKAAGHATDKIFGKKTPPAMPPGDGKRHGGLKGAITGENDELKQYAQQQRENSLNSLNSKSKNTGSDKTPTAASPASAASGKAGTSIPADKNFHGSNKEQTPLSPTGTTKGNRSHDSGNLQKQSVSGFDKPNSSKSTVPPAGATIKNSPAAGNISGKENLNNTSGTLGAQKTFESVKSDQRSSSSVSSPSAPTKDAAVLSSPQQTTRTVQSQAEKKSPAITNDFAKQPVDFAKPHRNKK